MISICIPSYNRPNELLRLLNSIKGQNGDFEIVIAEDFSPKRDKIVEAVSNFMRENPTLNINLYLNQTNLGYDGNWRNLIQISNGDYCIFMGDDDIMTEGAVAKIQNVIDEYPEIGFILRSWDEIDLEGKPILIQKYYPKSKLFPSGEQTVVSFFRKSVFFSGLVVHRQSAQKYETEKVDGKLLYQLYLLSNLILDKPAFYISDVIATHIKGGEHFFGSSEKEKGKFEPKLLTIEHSLNFMAGFIEIAELIDKERKTNLRNKVINDLSKYSFGFLVVQRKKGILEFINYVVRLKRMGYGKTLYFYLFSVILVLLGDKCSENIIAYIKTKAKSIPKL